MQSHRSRSQAKPDRPQRGAFARSGIRGVGVLTQRLGPFAGLLDNSLPPGSSLRAQAESQAARYIGWVCPENEDKDAGALISLGQHALDNEDSLTACIEGDDLSLKLWKLTGILKGTVLIMPVSFAYDNTLREPFRALVQRFLGQVFCEWPDANQCGVYEYAKEGALDTFQDMKKHGKDEEKHIPYQYDTAEQYEKMITMFVGEDQGVLDNIKKPDVPLTEEELLQYTPLKDERELYDMMLRGLELSASVGDPFRCIESVVDPEAFEQRAGECDQMGCISDKVFLAPTPGGINEMLSELDNMAYCWMYEEGFMVEQDIDGDPEKAKEAETRLTKYFDWAGKLSCLVSKQYYGIEL